MASGTAAVYSPPTKTPPRKRSATTSAIVPAPSTVWPGTTAMSPVVTAMPARATRVVAVRPTRSASGPKTAAPIGRPSSVAANTQPVAPARCPGPNSCAAAGVRAATGSMMSNWST